MDKTLDLDELERVARVIDPEAFSSPIPGLRMVAVQRARSVLALIAARQQETVISDEVVERMAAEHQDALYRGANGVHAMRAALSLLPVRVDLASVAKNAASSPQADDAASETPCKSDGA